MLRRKKPPELMKLEESIQNFNTKLPFFNFSDAKITIQNNNWYSNKISNFKQNENLQKLNFDIDKFKDDKIENRSISKLCDNLKSS